MSSDITVKGGGGVQGQRFDLLQRNAQKELFYVSQSAENSLLIRVKRLPLVFFRILRAAADVQIAADGSARSIAPACVSLIRLSILIPVSPAVWVPGPLAVRRGLGATRTLLGGRPHSYRSMFN